MVSLDPDKTGRVDVQTEYYVFLYFKPDSSNGKGQEISETNCGAQYGGLSLRCHRATVYRDIKI